MAKNSLESELEFLPPRAAAMLRTGQIKSYHAQKAILIFFLVFLVWSYFAELNEVTKGTGKIVTSSHIQTINNLEGGIVQDILVAEGEVVEQGQVLARMDTTMSRAKYAQDVENYYRYLAVAERLRTQINNQNFAPSQELMQFAPVMVAQENERFRSMMAKKQNEIAIAAQDVAAKKAEMLETKARLDSMKAQHDLAVKQLELIQPLADRKIYSNLDFIKVKRDVAEQKAQMDSLQASTDRQNIALSQAQDRLNQIPIRYHNDDLQELRDIEVKLNDARGAQMADSNRIMRSEVRAPLKGTVRDIKVHTKGVTIQPGETIMDIVPLDDALLAEIQLPPADIASIRPGMSATIKLTAYDFSTYGGVDAMVVEVSPDTIEDKREQSSFRVMLRTNTSMLIKNGKSFPIKPGMQLEADILTGKKSVFKYLMKPFFKALTNSMTEK
jgi:membrane fusion protein, adhesin transport system